MSATAGALKIMMAAGCLALAVAASLAQAESAARPVTAERLENADAEPGNWMSHGRTYSEQRYTPLTQIDAATLPRLKLAWSYDIDETRPVESTPIVIDGVLYATAAWGKVFALDAATGREIWRYDPRVDQAWDVHTCCRAVNRGVAVWNGKVYVGATDGRLIALDAQTGKPVWQQMTIDPEWPYSITGAPRVFKGKVIIGNSGADLGVRGYVTAYDAETGKQLWRFYTVPGNPADGFENDAMRMAAKTWNGTWWKFGGGGTVYDAIVYDPEFDLVYIGVGNGSPWDQHIRSPGGGDNLFLASIVALRGDTGEYVWHYQTTPGESWDYTATQPMILADLDIDGKTRKVLMQAPKNGFFYVLDRQTGALISAEKHVPTNWATHIDLKTGRPAQVAAGHFPDGKVIELQPGAFGGHNWNPMAFSPRTGLVYFPSSINSMSYGDEPGYEFVKGYSNEGNCSFCKATPNPALPVAPPRNFLLAWDPVHQKAAWRLPAAGRDGGVLATASDLIFQGGADGMFNAYDAVDGRKLWSRDIQNGALSGPVSYTVNGEQYIAIAVGGGYAGMVKGPVAYPAELPNLNRVLAFKLDGTAELPAVDYHPRPLSPPPPQTAGAAELAIGDRTFHRFCMMCHGAGARGDGVRPDLRYSDLLGNKDAWAEVVIGGGRESRGMVSFKDVVSAAQAEAIRAYVIQQAHINIAHSAKDVGQ